MVRVWIYVTDDHFQAADDADELPIVDQYYTASSPAAVSGSGSTAARWLVDRSADADNQLQRRISSAHRHRLPVVLLYSFSVRFRRAAEFTTGRRVRRLVTIANLTLCRNNIAARLTGATTVL